MTSVKGPRTFKNTIEPLAKVDYEYASIVTPLLFLKNVHTSKEIRDASLTADKSLDAYDIKEGMNDALYKALSDYESQAKKSKEWDQLTNEDRRFVEKMIQDFKVNGIDLPADKRKKLQDIKHELGELERKADRNLNEDKTKVEVEEKLLEGLSQSSI